MKIIKRKFLTLLEVMIAMGLAMVVLTALGTFHWQMVAMGVKAENERSELFAHLLLQHRIDSCMGRLKTLDGKKSHYFYSSENAPYTGLVFSYDRGNDLNKPFSSSSLGRLFVFGNDLYLATLPSPADWTEEQPPILVEKLAEDVADFNIGFVDSKGIESQTWSQEQKSLPAIVKIAMKINGKPYEHRVVLPVYPIEISP